MPILTDSADGCTLSCVSDAAIPIEERWPRPAVMGVLNVTPDSFSDGGQFVSVADAIAHGRRLAAEGAALVDVGGESTRPGAEPVDADEELGRVAPVLEGLAGIPLSIDTSKAAVARRALELGAELVNDVTALRGDPELAGVVAEGAAYVCLMHMQGEPRTMQAAPRYDDVASEVFAFLEERVAFAVEAGIPEERICVDPGIGFGKTPDQNLELIRRLDSLLAAGPPGACRRLAQEHARARAGRPRREHWFARVVARRRRGSLRARRVDAPRPRRARDRRGARGCGSCPTRKGDGMTIELLGLVLFGHHGYLEAERKLGQRFLVDLWVEVDDQAAASDEIEHTVDYRHLAALVREVFAGPERLLLEALAGAVVDGIFERFPGAQSVRIRVRKPDVVLDPPVEHAAVIVERRRG